MFEVYSILSVTAKAIFIHQTASVQTELSSRWKIHITKAALRVSGQESKVAASRRIKDT